jgi:hypothetical protein
MNNSRTKELFSDVLVEVGSQPSYFSKFVKHAGTTLLSVFLAACGASSGSPPNDIPPPQAQEASYNVKAEDAARRYDNNKVYVDNGLATLVHGPTGRTATSNNANQNHDYVLRVNTANTTINPNADSTLTFKHTAYYNFQRIEEGLGTNSRNLNDMFLAIRQQEPNTSLIPDFKTWYINMTGPVEVVWKIRPTPVYFDTATLGAFPQQAQIFRQALDSWEACGPAGFPSLSGKLYVYVTSPPTEGIMVQGASSISGSEAVQVTRTFGLDNNNNIILTKVVYTINTSTSLITPAAVINFRNTAKHGIGHDQYPDDPDPTHVMNPGNAINSTIDISQSPNECLGKRYKFVLPNAFNKVLSWP